jgi:hypothetical protein
VIEIPLTQGKVAIVDDEDAHLARFKWCAHRGRNTWYARRKVGQIHVLLHREILGVTDPAMKVDHADGNGLDCRRLNLRTASHAENSRNSCRPKTNTSGFRGVRWKKERGWNARIRAGGKQQHLGHFATAEDAARAYDAAARRQHGAFAAVNFPLDGERAA